MIGYYVSVTSDGREKGSGEVDLSQSPGLGINIRPGSYLEDSKGARSIYTNVRVRCTSLVSVEDAFEIASDFADANREGLEALDYMVLDGNFAPIATVPAPGPAPLEKGTIIRAKHVESGEIHGFTVTWVSYDRMSPDHVCISGGYDRDRRFASENPYRAPERPDTLIMKELAVRANQAVADLHSLLFPAPTYR